MPINQTKSTKNVTAVQVLQKKQSALGQMERWLSSCRARGIGTRAEVTSGLGVNARHSGVAARGRNNSRCALGIEGLAP